MLLFSHYMHSHEELSLASPSILLELTVRWTTVPRNYQQWQQVALLHYLPTNPLVRWVNPIVIAHWIHNVLPPWAAVLWCARESLTPEFGPKTFYLRCLLKTAWKWKRWDGGRPCRSLDPPINVATALILQPTTSRTSVQCSTIKSKVRTLGSTATPH